jgi:hypothetical protein
MGDDGKAGRGGSEQRQVGRGQQHQSRENTEGEQDQENHHDGPHRALSLQWKDKYERTTAASSEIFTVSK